MNRVVTIIAVPLGFALGGCAEPVRLQLGYGSSYHEALTRQADLERPSVQDQALGLTGEEGVALRQRVAEATSDAAEVTSVSETE